MNLKDLQSFPPPWGGLGRGGGNSRLQPDAPWGRRNRTSRADSRTLPPLSFLTFSHFDATRHIRSRASM